MIIKLTDENIQYITELATKRNKKEKRFGACTYGGKGSHDAHFIGLVGEFAVAQSLDKKVDERIFDNCGDNGFDIDKWGVKTSTHITDPYSKSRGTSF